MLLVPLAALWGCSMPIAQDKARGSTQQAGLAALPGEEEEEGGLCSHPYQQSPGSLGSLRCWCHDFLGGWKGLQGAQMSQDTGTGHGSEGGTDTAKAAGQGSSTGCKGSLAKPRPGRPAASHQQLAAPPAQHARLPDPPQVTKTLQAATILPSREENKCI